MAGIFLILIGLFYVGCFAAGVIVLGMISEALFGPGKPRQ